MPVLALAALLSASPLALPLALLLASPLALAVPVAATGLERGSPFYRVAPYLAPPAATFSAPAGTERLRPVHVQAAPPARPGGRLPNQETGPRRDRAVRDICIGC